MNKGTISQVIGPVVDVHFKDKVPGIYNALEINLSLNPSSQNNLSVPSGHLSSKGENNKEQAMGRE